ncbi:MAG: carboxypeptidase regulatory-like domain-containing protein [Vicinamibacterales bacterium]
MAIRRFLLPLAVLCLLTQVLAAQGSVTGRVVDPSGLPLPGVLVELSQAGTLLQSTTTDGTGTFALGDVPDGRYDMRFTLDGFAATDRRQVLVGAAQESLLLRLELADVHQDVTVTAPTTADLLSVPEPDAVVSVTRDVMDVAMLPNSQIDDVLPLMPNVVRGPDGLIAIAGARAAATGLSVDGRDGRDPILGGSGLMLPPEAVETMSVYSGGAPAEYGNATGGITSISTRAGTDSFRMHADSFFPRLLYDEGLSGVAYWDPNIGIGGPLIRGRVALQQSVSYRFDQNTFTTLAGPDRNEFNALLSWTQLDVRVSDAQRLRISAGADPRSTDRANITAFTPAAVMPRIGLGGWTAAVNDSVTTRKAVFEFGVSTMRPHLTVTPHGSEPYDMHHDLVQGSYFDDAHREATRIEAGGRAVWPVSATHTVTAGAHVSRAVLDQTIEAHAIRQWRSDGTLARTISFLPALPSHVASTAYAAFVQDRWSVRPTLTIDAGLRIDGSDAANRSVLAPRLGWTLGKDDGNVTLRGSVGVFGETLPLAAVALTALPVRAITTFDSSAGPSSPVIVAPEHAPALDSPRARRWDLDADRRIGPWMIRARLEGRAGQRELIVSPGPASVTDVTQVELLSSTGTSRAVSLETTAGYRSTSGTEWYVSYVRATTSGPQNSLDATEGLLRVPFVQAAGGGPLPADVPHRLLAWGVLHLPGSFTVAPFLDARSGFPYTATDDEWNQTGAVNGKRLPAAASLDISVTRVMGLPHDLPDARVGLKLYNVASVHTERDVQTDASRPDFGVTYDPVPRDFSIVFELLWGRRHR